MTRRFWFVSLALLFGIALLYYAKNHEGQAQALSKVHFSGDPSNASHIPNPAGVPADVRTVRNVATSAASSASAGSTNEATSPVFHQDPFEASQTERLASISHGIELMYGKTIRALKLSPGDEAKLRKLLGERAEAAYIAHDVVTDRDHKPGDLKTVIAAAQAEIDEDIKANFDAETAKKIQLMLMASQYLTRVNQSIDRALAEAGEPLSPEQVLPLAVILMETYGSPNNPDTRPSVANVNPATNLTPADELAFERASALLSTQQLVALKRLFSTQNKAALDRTTRS